MSLFLLIPLSLVACTIAIGPVLAAMLRRDAERDALHEVGPTRLPWGIGGATAVPVPAPVADAGHRTRARAA